MPKKHLFLLTIFSLISLVNIFAQFGYSSELGIVFGPTSFQSDFGSREDTEAYAGNSGFGIGVVHYLNLSISSGCNCYTKDTYFNDHIKIRSEFSFNSTDLNHFGRWVSDEKESEASKKLRAHSGKVNNFELGSGIEYFPLSVTNFQNYLTKFAPYISIGAHATYSIPGVSTTYGDQDINNPNNFYPGWDSGSINNQETWALSIVGSIGTRYKLAQYSDVVIDMRWQYFNKDTIDGLDHNLPSNKFNDWMIWLNMGYVYYLD